MPKLDDQISTLQEKLSRLKLRQQRLGARRQAIAANRDRKADTRRKILLGGIIMVKMTQSDADRARILAWLDEALTRSTDRALFDLAPLPQDGRT
jgi:transposase